MDSNLMSEICEFILNNLNEEISINDIENNFHYNRFYIIRKFKEYTGCTITEYINSCKVYNTVDPLIITDDTVLKIALNNGFNSLEYYSEKFKDIIGLSPLKFRKEYKENLPKLALSNNKEELYILKEYLENIKDKHEKLLELSNRESEKVMKKTA